MAEEAPGEAPEGVPEEAPEKAPEDAPDDGSSVVLETPATVAGVTLGQMLHISLGSAREGVIDFETLHNLLNGLLLHLGLKDLLVQANGEPLEGAEESPFAFLKELKQRLEANEREMAEFRSLCQDLREEVSEMKAEQDRLAADMQKVMDNIDVENFQNMLDELRKQVLDSVLAALRDQDGGWKDGSQTSSWDEPGLIVIGNEITLLERIPIPKHRDMEPRRPLSAHAKTPDMERGLEANDMGQIKDEDTKMSSSRASPHVHRKSPDGFTASRMHPGAPGTHSPVQRVQSPQGQPRPQTPRIPAKDGAGTSKHPTSKEAGGRSSRMEAGEGSSRMEAGGHSLRMEAGGHSSRMEAGGHSLRMEAGGHSSRMEAGGHSLRMEAGGHSLRMEAGGHRSRMEAGVHSSRMEAGERSSRMEAGGGSSRMEAGGRSSRMEPSPAEDGLMLLKVPSSEYLPCDPLVQLPGLHAETIPSTPPPSPGLSGRLPRALKKSPREKEKEPDYHRGSPRYCGGRHTSTFPRQPMESLLPDPNKPGVIELMGTDGLVYRGRTAPETDSPRDASPQK